MPNQPLCLGLKIKYQVRDEMERAFISNNVINRSWKFNCGGPGATFTPPCMGQEVEIVIRWHIAKIYLAIPTPPTTVLAYINGPRA